MVSYIRGYFFGMKTYRHESGEAMYITYRQVSRGKLRLLFNLHTKELVIPGQIYLRTDAKADQDRYFYNFGGKFSWEVGENLPPFRFDQDDLDLSFELFYGVPQGLLKIFFDFVPRAAERFALDNNRNCGNCLYHRFAEQTWEHYQNLPVSQRHTAQPRHLFTCYLSGQAIDHVKPDEKPTPQNLRYSLRNNGCGAHTRRAYSVSVDPSARTGILTGVTQRWVPAEHRRLGCLNPQLVDCRSDQLILAAQLELSLKPEKP
jgi:hypothetical protein